ncbi:MAG: HD domain-containing phosphohydrolase [Pseudomonadota bacterium]
MKDIRSGMDDAAFKHKPGISIEELESRSTRFHGGETAAQPTSGTGVSTPEMSLHPVSRGNHPGDREPEHVMARHPDRRQVLAITDDRVLLDTLHRLFARRDVRILTCTNRIPGIDDLDRMGPDLVLFDSAFPEMTMDEVLGNLKRIDPCIPLILATDRATSIDCTTSEEESIYDVVEKPVNGKALLRSILRGLEHCGLARFKRNHIKVMEDAIQEKTMEIVRTKDFLKGILNSSTLVSVVLTDLEQNVLFWNKGAENIFGYSADEIVGTKITRLYPADSLTTDTVDQLRGTVQRSGRTVQGKMKQVAKDGSVLTVSLAISPMLDAFGEIQGILGVGLDVTEEVRQQKKIVELLSQVKKTQEVSIFTLARLAESRDEETGFHLSRIQQYCRILCNGLAELPRHRETVTRFFADDLYQSCVLHDIGKVAIPDSILMSKEKFGPKEREIMQQHPMVGGQAIEEAVERLGEKSFLTIGMEVAYYHHEHWDGSGYPFGMKGPEIPLSARIVAVADVYDALTSQRRYKGAFSHEETCRIIVEEKGRQFDPDVVEVFQDLADEFRTVRNTFTST